MKVKSGHKWTIIHCIPCTANFKIHKGNIFILVTWKEAGELHWVLTLFHTNCSCCSQGKSAAAINQSKQEKTLRAIEDG